MVSFQFLGVVIFWISVWGIRHALRVDLGLLEGSRKPLTAPVCSQAYTVCGCTPRACAACVTVRAGVTWFLAASLDVVTVLSFPFGVCVCLCVFV